MSVNYQSFFQLSCEPALISAVELTTLGADSETGREIIMEKTKKLSNKHHMIIDPAVPEGRWEWKLDGSFSMNWTVSAFALVAFPGPKLNLVLQLRRPIAGSSDLEVLARWQDSSFAIKKDGKLVINGVGSRSARRLSEANFCAFLRRLPSLIFTGLCC